MQQTTIMPNPAVGGEEPLSHLLFFLAFFSPQGVALTRHTRTNGNISNSLQTKDGSVAHSTLLSASPQRTFDNEKKQRGERGILRCAHCRTGFLWFAFQLPDADFDAGRVLDGGGKLLGLGAAIVVGVHNLGLEHFCALRHFHGRRDSAFAHR